MVPMSIVKGISISIYMSYTGRPGIHLSINFWSLHQLELRKIPEKVVSEILKYYNSRNGKTGPSLKFC